MRSCILYCRRLGHNVKGKSLWKSELECGLYDVLEDGHDCALVDRIPDAGVQRWCLQPPGVISLTNGGVGVAVIICNVGEEGTSLDAHRSTEVGKVGAVTVVVEEGHFVGGAVAGNVCCFTRCHGVRGIDQILHLWKKTITPPGISCNEAFSLLPRMTLWWLHN